METLYDVLGIDPDADSETIHTAYREQAKRHHPDASEGNDSERFKRLTTARDVLLDDARRKRYDRLGHRRYAVRHLGSEWPVSDSERSHSRQHSRSRGATTSRRRRRRPRRVRRERPPRRSGPADGLVALSTYWPILARAGIVLAALLALAFALSVLSL